MTHLDRGWVICCMRSGRYTYRKVLGHMTNPDHLVPSAGRPSESPPLQIAARYAAGRPSTVSPVAIEGVVSVAAREGVVVSRDGAFPRRA